MEKSIKNFIKSTTCLILIILILCGTVFTIAFFVMNTIGYSVEIKDNDIPIGNNMSLKYVVSKEFFAPIYENVTMDVWIEDEKHNKVISEIREGVIDINKQTFYGYIILPTHKLDAGTYRIWSRLNYEVDDKMHHASLWLRLFINKLNIKHLGR